MTKIVKRYCFCAISVVAVVLIIYYNIFDRPQYELINYRDEFVVVAYVDDYDNQNHVAIERLVNLTDFQYLLEPNMCNSQQKNDEFLGEPNDARRCIRFILKKFNFGIRFFFFFCSNSIDNIVCWPR